MIAYNQRLRPAQALRISGKFIVYTLHFLPAENSPGHSLRNQAYFMNGQQRSAQTFKTKNWLISSI